MPWLSRLKPWLWIRKSFTKPSKDDRVDSKRPSSEQNAESPHEKGHKTSEKVASEPRNFPKWRMKWKKRRRSQFIISKTEGSKDLKTHQLWHHSHSAKTQPSRPQPPIPPLQQPTSIVTEMSRPTHAPVYRQPRRAAVSFLQTTKHASDKRSSRSRRPHHSHVHKRKSANEPTASEHRLPQVAEESESQEASRSRSRRREDSVLSSPDMNILNVYHSYSRILEEE